MATFLDAAGTLIHPRVAVGESYAEIARRHGIDASAAVVDAAFRQAWKQTPPPFHPEGLPADDDDRSWWQTLVEKTFHSVCGQPLDTGTLAPLFDDLYGHFAQAEAWAVYDDVRPALARMADLQPLWVLSNFDRRLHTILEGHELMPFFQGIILSSEVGASKPHPRMFQAALRAAAADADPCYHIGDDPDCDYQGASAAGMAAFLLDRPRITLTDALAWLRRNHPTS